ncbi:hypothetical protein HanRHA438_Chr01g0040101 [Helianthus annuus]|nr:hypothetical protein HanRHA438_Chr01g0040101 [Helianthus annuus]
MHNIAAAHPLSPPSTSGDRSYLRRPLRHPFFWHTTPPRPPPSYIFLASSHTHTPVSSYIHSPPKIEERERTEKESTAEGSHLSSSGVWWPY